MSWETSNKLIGTTKNPHDTTRTCGGSSGGEVSHIKKILLHRVFCSSCDSDFEPKLLLIY